ncbi:MAG: tryptophan 2,3-dioxygenase [Candidatus Dormibacteraeota bacterium]|nr:tryptophan 2,3-dioxygenase [Candidatus Dormibacteraeota bacterium]MBV8446280.1 tryptophan 2,3-dioxygenase [Candidatus Dormibacteraeota bacterium]
MERTDYTTYLHIDELLRLQHPLSDGAHDEMLFVITHQVYELWFKLILHELDHARDVLLQSQPQLAVAPLRRTVMIEELLITQLRILETMSPDGFMRFRDPLAPASGFQSGQFRAIESIGGIRPPALFDDPVLSDHDRQELRRRAGQPTLFEALCASLRSAGLDAPDGAGVDEHARRLASLVALYREHAGELPSLLHQVCELLLDHDEALARWRSDHALMAAREIGLRQGTGGSLGVAYLLETLGTRLFPELWEVRSLL